MSTAPGDQGPAVGSGSGGASPTTDAYQADVEKVRAWSGLIAVVAGDVVIALAAIFALYEISTTQASATAIVSILTSAFTAIGTLTTAYFGIKAAANTAQNSLGWTPQGERPSRSQAQPPDKRQG